MTIQEFLNHINNINIFIDIESSDDIIDCIDKFLSKILLLHKDLKILNIINTNIGIWFRPIEYATEYTYTDIYNIVGCKYILGIPYDKCLLSSSIYVLLILNKLPNLEKLLEGDNSINMDIITKLSMSILQLRNIKAYDNISDNMKELIIKMILYIDDITMIMLQPQIDMIEYSYEDIKEIKEVNLIINPNSIVYTFNIKSIRTVIFDIWVNMWMSLKIYSTFHEYYKQVKMKPFDIYRTLSF